MGLSGPRQRRSVALSVAGSDSSGGAGVVADVKTFEALGVWAAVAITAVTAQSPDAVVAIHPVPSALVVRQIEAVAESSGVAALKTGMLASAETANAVAEAVARLGLPNLVVDPVVASTSGADLFEGRIDELLSLLSLATVVTPNLDEGAAILGGGRAASRHEMEAQAHAIGKLGPRAVLLTGGHLDGPDAADLLHFHDRNVWLVGPRIASEQTHGSGCVLSAAIAARLARGDDIETACRIAKGFVTRAIAAGAVLGFGSVAPGALSASPDR